MRDVSKEQRKCNWGVDCILPFSLYSQAQVKVISLFVQKLFKKTMSTLKKKYSQTFIYRPLSGPKNHGR
jgi:hypothetical protein